MLPITKNRGNLDTLSDTLSVPDEYRSAIPLDNQALFLNENGLLRSYPIENGQFGEELHMPVAGGSRMVLSDDVLRIYFRSGAAFSVSAMRSTGLNGTGTPPSIPPSWRVGDSSSVFRSTPWRPDGRPASFGRVSQCNVLRWSSKPRFARRRAGGTSRTKRSGGKCRRGADMRRRSRELVRNAG